MAKYSLSDVSRFRELTLMNTRSNGDTHMRSNCLQLRNTISMAFVLLTLLLLSGCGGGGGSSSGGGGGTLEVPPAAPSGIQVTINSSNQLTLSWSKSANATSYNVYGSNAVGVSKNSTKLSAANTSMQFTHSGLVTGNTYYYVVTALNSFGESSESVEVFALLDTPQPPASVVGLSGAGKATLSWNNNGVTSYNVYSASVPGVTKANYATLLDGAAHIGVSSAFELAGLVNGKTYYFVVTGVNTFGESIESSEVVVTPSINSGLTVAGAVRYEDKEYGPSGFTGLTYFKAVRFATVEVVDALSAAVIVAGTTDATGAYSLTIPATYSGKSIYVRVVSTATTPSILVNDFSDSLYAVATHAFPTAGTAVANISIPKTSQADGAFNVLDVYVSGAQFMQTLTGAFPPTLNVYWQPSNPNGTYYCNSTPNPFCPYGEAIYVLNDGLDADEFDDDVLWHEYGHFVISKYSKDDSPGGAHFVSSNDLDLRLAWSEGWGDFFPSAVKSWLPQSLKSTPLTMADTVYVDTSGTGGNSFDFGNPPAGPSYYYATSEAAVAKVLVDIRSNPAFGMQAVWDTVVSAPIKQATTPVNLEVFWDGWNLLGKADVTPILNARSITYSADVYEVGDNNFSNQRKAVIAQAESHTLFGSGDVDYIAFDAMAGQQYTIRTTSIKNGADTVVRVFAPDQATIVASNDNTNGLIYLNSVPNNCDWNTGACHENALDILGSTAVFTPNVTGLYYVEVQGSVNRPLSAGRYGNYTLTITSP